MQECLFLSSYRLCYRSRFGQCFAAVRGRVLQRQTPCCHPAPSLLRPCSIFKIQIRRICDVGCAVPPQMLFPYETLAFRPGFVTQLCTLWSDVLNPLALVPELPFASEGLGCCHTCGVVVRSGVFCPDTCSQHCEQSVMEEVLVLLLTISFAFR